MEEEKINILLLLIMIILELVLMIRIFSKVRSEKAYLKKCRKLSAVVRSVAKERVTSKTVMCSFEVKADDGCIYNVHSCSGTAFLIAEGSTVEILVPDGVSGRSEEDECFEKICLRGEEALNSLSEDEKIRLNKYLDRRLENLHYHSAIDEHFRHPSLVSDGGGLKHEILPMCIIAAVVAVVIVITAIHIFTVF